jgi:hypothetical protein
MRNIMAKTTSPAATTVTVWQNALNTAAEKLDDAETLWVGRSGEQVTGEAAARHLEATAALLEKDGWVRHYTDDESDIDLPDDESMSVKDMVRQLYRVVRELVGPGDPRRTLFTALRDAAESAESDSDTIAVASQCLDRIVRARTGTDWAYCSSWAERTGRTWTEVAEVLATGAAFARTYGPASQEAAAA